MAPEMALGDTRGWTRGHLRARMRRLLPPHGPAGLRRRHGDAGDRQASSGRAGAAVAASRPSACRPHLEQLVLACLAKKPEDRPQSAAERCQRARLRSISNRGPTSRPSLVGGGGHAPRTGGRCIRRIGHSRSLTRLLGKRHRNVRSSAEHGHFRRPAAYRAGEPRTRDIGTRPTTEIVRLINDEDARVAQAVEKELPQVASAVDGIVARLEHDGRLFYVGTGTSGRLGILDASECAPTFGVAADLVQGIIAGGYEACYRAVEASEDDRAAGGRDLDRRGVTGVMRWSASPRPGARPTRSARSNARASSARSRRR